MYFNSRFHKPISKESKKIDFDKVFKLKKKNEIILPLGSCFLEEFSYHLHQKKFNICSNPKLNKISKMGRPSKEKGFQFFFGNFYNPLNLLDNLERIINNKWKLKNNDFLLNKEANHYINLFVKSRNKSKKIEDIKKKIIEMDQYLIQEIKKSTTILLGFDTAEIWIDKYSQKAWYTFYGNIFNQKPYKNRAKLVTLNANKIKNTIKKIIKILNKIGKKKKFILLGSPHPLIATYNSKDHQISNWYDRSNFISAYTDLVSENIAYFPVNEILDNFKEKEVYENNFFYLKSKTKKNILIPYFEKLYF